MKLWPVRVVRTRARKDSPQVALPISTVVGFVLFAFSPISFIVFAPELFGVAGNPGQQFVGLHQHILEVFWPFILSAGRMGALFGALEAVNARTLFARRGGRGRVPTGR